MVISYKNRFIFIHVPKVAGQSIRSALKKYGRVNNYYSINKLTHKLRIEHWFYHFKALCLYGLPNHGTALEIKRKVPKKKWNKYFKFGFVRNPYDWHVSNFNHIKRALNHPKYDILKNIDSFKEYLELEVKYNITSKPNTLSKFLTDDKGEIMVDFVGKFEKLEDDFNKIQKIIGINEKMPHLNKSNHKTYKEYYNDQRCIELVNKHNYEDFKRFGYDIL